MNVETTPIKSSKRQLSSKKLGVKTVAISFSLLLGACATSEKKVEPATPASAKVEAAEEKVDSAPAPTAAQLMKTLKAPLVEPPGEAKKVVQSKPVPVQAEKKIEKAQEKVSVAEASVKTEALKVEPALEAKFAETKTEKLPAVPVITTSTTEAVSTEVAKVPATNAKPFNVSASKLPFNYDIWTIKKGNTPLTQGLVISPPTWEMGKEGYMSQIWFTLMEDKLHVNSSSDIETASKGLGIRIDGGDLIPFSSIAENNIGVISGKWLDRLAAANKVDVYLGFFPGKRPTSDTFTSDLSLNNLARVVATYRMLNQ